MIDDKIRLINFVKTAMDPNLDYSFDPEFDPDILTQYLREGIDYELVDVEENVENIPPEPIDKVQVDIWEVLKQLICHNCIPCC